MADHSTNPGPKALATNVRRSTFPVTTAEHLRAIGDPTRWAILGALIEGPASVQELSRRMGIPKGTIGHHVKVLADAGLIGVVETKRVRGVEEKRYARLAGKFALPDEESDLAAIGATDEDEVFGIPLRGALGEATVGHGPDEPSTSVVIRARMSPERARRFVTLVDTMAAEFSEGGGSGDDARTFGFVAAIYLPSWSTGRRKGR